MGREVEGPAISSPVITFPEKGLFIRSEAEESFSWTCNRPKQEQPLSLGFRSERSEGSHSCTCNRTK